MFYCVLKGRIKLKIKVSDQYEEFLYKVNDRFGYEEFFIQRLPTYTAQADCFSRVSKISRTNFIACLREFPVLYINFVKKIQRMNFSQNRQILGQRCWFCNSMHTPLKCPTKTKWRYHLIRKDPISFNHMRMLSSMDKTES